MIATILPGSTNFHAVGYNERKVSKGVARLIEMKNFGHVGKFEKYTVSELIQFLTDYSSRNDRIKKPQFHVAISCRGQENTEQELLDFAHEYLQEMGYGQEGQPILIYAHDDTDNRHLHIITSRIDPNGKKIDHNHERRRSQIVIDKILSRDRDEQVNSDLEKAKGYKFNTDSQFKAVLTSMGYETYEEDDFLYIKKGGIVHTNIPMSEINLLCSRDTTPDLQRIKQLGAIFKKYRNIVSGKEQLQKFLKSKFGIDLVFYGNSDSPYGYVVIDHKNSAVYAGAKILKIKELLDFSANEAADPDLTAMEKYIDHLLEVNPKITPLEASYELSRMGGYVKAGFVGFRLKRISKKLKLETADVLNRNFRIDRIEHFNPVTEKERNLLCKVFKVEDCNLVKMSSDRNGKYNETVSFLKNCFATQQGWELRATIRGAGMIIKRDGDDCFVLDFGNKTIVHLQNEGFDVGILGKYQPATAKKTACIKDDEKVGDRKTENMKGDSGGVGHGKIMKRDSGGIGHGQNREWEVGRNGRYDVVDDHIDSGQSY